MVRFEQGVGLTDVVLPPTHQEQVALSFRGLLFVFPVLQISFYRETKG